MNTTSLAAVIAALALTGCTTPDTTDTRQSDTPAPATTSSRLPIAHVTTPTDPNTDVSSSDAEMSRYDLDDPTEAATALIIDALADEGLLATSTDTQLLTRDDRWAQVKVKVNVAHSPGHGHPIQSSYLLELARDPALDPWGWRIVAFTEPA